MYELTDAEHGIRRRGRSPARYPPARSRRRRSPRPANEAEEEPPRAERVGRTLVADGESDAHAVARVDCRHTPGRLHSTGCALRTPFPLRLRDPGHACAGRPTAYPGRSPGGDPLGPGNGSRWNDIIHHCHRAANKRRNSLVPTIQQLVRKGRQAEGQQDQDAGPQGQPAAARRLHARVHHDPEEAELGPAQGRARAG